MTTFATARVEQGQRELLICVKREAHPPGFYLCEDAIDGGDYIIHMHNIKTTADDAIPARFSRKAFDRMAPHIGAALKAAGQVIAIKSHLSANTLARCLQEALVAKKRYAYTHPSIDEHAWSTHGADLGTAMKDAFTVYLGPKSILRQGITSVVGETVSPTEIQHQVQNTWAHLERVCFLLHSKALVPPPRFFVLGITNETIIQLETQYDVVFSQDEINKDKYFIS